MIGKLKKIFFNGVFGVLYVSFAAQLVYVLGWVNNIDTKFIALGALALEWMIIIAARYLSKKSAGGGHRDFGHNNHYRR